MDHRDIKANNVVVTNDGKIKILTWPGKITDVDALHSRRKIQSI